LSGFCFSFHPKHSFAVFKKKGKKPHSEAVKKGANKNTLTPTSPRLKAFAKARQTRPGLFWHL